MRVFPVLYMETEKNRLEAVNFPFCAFMAKNREKKKECSAWLWSSYFLSKLMLAANCVPFCQNPFCL